MDDPDKTVIGIALPTVEPSSIILRDSQGAEFEVLGDMTVGRGSDCDITIDDGRVSRKHATISVSDGDLTIEDLGSANGTYVNSERLQGQATLKDGDTVAFDNNVFTLLIAKPGADGAKDEAVDPDATMIGMAPPPAPEPKPAVAEEALKADPPKADEPKVDLKLPGSWDESEGVDGTQLLQIPDLPDMSEALQAAAAGVDSNAPHLVVTTATGSQMVELSVGASNDTSVWEIGREQTCEVVIDDPSVSSKHAQLVFSKGRWRMVNMVSTNGIFVNGEKKLSAYLAEGDVVQLGAVKLMFRAGSTAGSSSSSSAGAVAEKDSMGGSVVKIVIPIIVLALLGAYFVLFA